MEPPSTEQKEGNCGRSDEKRGRNDQDLSVKSQVEKSTIPGKSLLK